MQGIKGNLNSSNGNNSDIETFTHFELGAAL